MPTCIEQIEYTFNWSPRVNLFYLLGGGGCPPTPTDPPPPLLATGLVIQVTTGRQDRYNVSDRFQKLLYRCIGL